MFNVLTHKENANQNCTEIPSHSSQNGNHQENKWQQVLVRMLVELGTTVTTMEISMELPQKTCTPMFIVTLFTTAKSWNQSGYIATG
jgi:hypothetical protein